MEARIWLLFKVEDGNKICGKLRGEIINWQAGTDFSSKSRTGLDFLHNPSATLQIWHSLGIWKLFLHWKSMDRIYRPIDQDRLGPR
jgi:hypothetical protein